MAAQGETLPFPGGRLHTILIGWVLRHDAGAVNAGQLLRAAARVTAPGGWLLSVEPLDERFDQSKWLTLIAQEVLGCAVLGCFTGTPKQIAIRCRS